MMEHRFSGGDDTVDATGDPYHPTDLIFAGAGDDHVTIDRNILFVSEEGNDTVVGADERGEWAAWSAPVPVFVNLAEGWAEDGYGGRDTLQGITALHMPGVGGSAVGSDRDETVFNFGGYGTYDMGAGLDQIVYLGQQSGAFTILHHGDTTVVYNAEGAYTLKGVEQLTFDDVAIDLTYEQAPFRVATSDPLHRFIETEFSEGYTYAGVFSPPGVIQYFVNNGGGGTLDINGDGYQDAVLPLMRAYRTGADSRSHFLVFTGGSDGLTYDPDLTARMPFVGGAVAAKEIFIEELGVSALVTTNIGTAREDETDLAIPWATGELTVVAPDPDLNIAASIVPDEGLGLLALSGRTTAVSAHAFTIGDYDGDGLQDILIGDGDAPIVLRQTPTRPWDIIDTPFLNSLAGKKFDTTDGEYSVLLEVAMADLDGDGFEDLIAGWGHSKAESIVFFNDGTGDFTHANSLGLPRSVYGDNALHLATFTEDFDRDGDPDIVILYSRNDPYYGGITLQFLENDGNGIFVDMTEDRFGPIFSDATTYGGRLEWTGDWRVTDVNNDGAMDFLGRDPKIADMLILLLNDGAGHFLRQEFRMTQYLGEYPAVVGDFNNDGRTEFLSFSGGWTDDTGTAYQGNIRVHELPGSDWTHQTLQDLAERADRAGDTMVGTPAANRMTGSGQSDLLVGLAGDDTLSGGAGDDQLDAGEGDDLAYAGTGDDRLIGGTGNDTLYGAADSDTLIGGAGSDLLGGGGGDDHLSGGDEADALWGAAGNDSLEGGSGNDTLGAALGDDTLDGGDGDDEVWTSDGNDVGMGGAGDDTLGGAGGDDTLSGDSGADELWGAAGNDSLEGGDDDDRLGGGIGNDTADGGAGNDEVFGGLGDDDLRGGLGDDQIFGAAGDDTLTGGAGNDTVYGGPGADVFVFRVGDGADQIGGFSIANDMLLLDQALWGGGLTAAQVVTQFGSAQGADYVLDFGLGDTITLLGQATVSGLDGAIDIL